MQTLMRHKIILILVAIAIAGALWFGLSPSNSAPPSDLSVPSSGSGSAVGADQALVTTLLQLRAVKLDGTIFSDLAFLSLQDFSTQIVPEPVGRVNPFAPLGQNAAPSPATTKSAQMFKPRQ